MDLGGVGGAEPIELWRIECVQSFGTELRVDPLCDFERLVEGQVGVQIARAIAVRGARRVAVGEDRSGGECCCVDVVGQPALRRAAVAGLGPGHVWPLHASSDGAVCAGHCVGVYLRNRERHSILDDRDVVERPSADSHIDQPARSAEELLAAAEGQVVAAGDGVANGNVVDGARVLGLDGLLVGGRCACIPILRTVVAGVQGIGGAPRVVPVRRPGQRSQQREAVGKALLQLYVQSVVVGVSDADGVADGGVLGIRQQGLFVRDRGLTDESGSSSLVVGIRDFRQQSGLTEGEIFVRQLVDVCGQGEILCVRPDVAHLESEAISKVLLNVAGVLHHDGSVAIGIEERQRAAHAGRVAKRVPRRTDQAVGEWIAQGI